MRAMIVVSTVGNRRASFLEECRGGSDTEHIGSPPLSLASPTRLLFLLVERLPQLRAQLSNRRFSGGVSNGRPQRLHLVLIGFHHVPGDQCHVKRRLPVQLKPRRFRREIVLWQSVFRDEGVPATNSICPPSRIFRPVNKPERRGLSLAVATMDGLHHASARDRDAAAAEAARDSVPSKATGVSTVELVRHLGAREGSASCWTEFHVPTTKWFRVSV
jgi:hypothetical protein